MKPTNPKTNQSQTTSSSNPSSSAYEDVDDDLSFWIDDHQIIGVEADYFENRSKKNK